MRIDGIENHPNGINVFFLTDRDTALLLMLLMVNLGTYSLRDYVICNLNGMKWTSLVECEEFSCHHISNALVDQIILPGPGPMRDAECQTADSTRGETPPFYRVHE